MEHVTTYIDIWNSPEEYERYRNYLGEGDLPEPAMTEDFSDACFLNENWCPNRTMNAIQLDEWYRTRFNEYAVHAEPLYYDDIVVLEQFKKFYRRAAKLLTDKTLIRIYDK